LDLTSDESIQQCVKVIREKYSDFDCLIHCAGTGKVELIEEVSFVEADATFKLNVVGPLALTV